MTDQRSTIEHALAELSRSDSDADRSRRVRATCHRELTRRSRSIRPVSRRAIESALVGGFCAVYIVAVLLMAWHTHAAS